MLQEVFEVQAGIWIRERWIREAGLGRRLQVIVQPGEIRIVPAQMVAEPTASGGGWEVFRSLGNEAPPGQLPDAAVEHDRYLYVKGP